MTKTELASLIANESQTLTWKEATPGLRVQVILGLIDQLDGLEAEVSPEAAKKPKQRKSRGSNKPKPASLTQHAGGEDDIR